jgi:5-methylthioadenosine/S-adenosylhomocysteine deaminase
MGRLLIQHGTVIDVEARAGFANTDVLVEDDRIAAIGVGLDPTGAELVDARQRIVLPGFVDTHRHGWQSVLRAIAMDVDLGQYMQQVNGGLAPLLTPADVAVASELSALECLNAGVTTVQDYSHILYSPAHTDAVLAGLRAGGVRAAFGYSAPIFAGPQAWREDDIRRVRAVLPDDDGLITMMLAAIGPAFGGQEVTDADWKLAADLDLPLVTHVHATPDVPEPIGRLAEHGLLRDRTLYVHGNNLTDADMRRIADSGGALSFTPTIEQRMGMGGPLVNRTRRDGVVAGLGVDVVTSGPGDMFSVMRAALASEDVAGGDRVPVADVVALATSGGAAALGMGERIGALRAGMQADVVLLRTDDVSTVGGHDPFGVLVNAHPGVVDAVLVAGRFVKRDGKLLTDGVADLVARGQEIAARLATPATP